MCERDMSFNHLRWAWCILLIQRRSNLLCMLCSERQRKKNMNDRKSKFASINCEHGRKNRLLVNINGGFLFIYTLSGTFGVVGFFLFRVCSCSLFNSRTPRIYMLMMVCWLTKLRHEITNVWESAPKRTVLAEIQKPFGINMVSFGIMLCYVTYNICTLQNLFRLKKVQRNKF